MEKKSSNDLTSRYRDTVQLPKTDFPMKGDLPKKEPQILQKWESIGLYKRLMKKNEGRPTFTLPDGPPYANGHLHIGHALNKVLKDIVIKYRNMAGSRAPFVPGWDCHGLPIEQAVSKAVGGAKLKEMTDSQVRSLCRAEANKWIDIQRQQFIRWGVLGDWENPYRTMDPDYEAEEIRVLAKLLKTGAFYRGEKPVYWNTVLQTALAEAEVEYRPHKSPSIYVAFEVDKKTVPASLEKSRQVIESLEGLSFLIWTTTPWTLPANLAIALHPEFDYGVFKVQSPVDHPLFSQSVVMARALVEAVTRNTQVQLGDLGVSIKGRDLEGIVTQHPFLDRKSKIVLGEHVTLDAGTGCVHTAPGHGQDDYLVGLRYGLPILSPVDARGKYTSEFPLMAGQDIFESNPKIIELLRNRGRLFFNSELEHSYPHCWRTKVPLIFRATPQWFLRMDVGDASIRKRALKAINQVDWIPDWGRNRITGMIESRPDWCLSRQRIWGVPIPVFFCTKCDTELADEAVMLRVAEGMEKNGGLEAFHESPASEFTRGFACRKCGNPEFKKSRDILDVWFDSGVCFEAVQKKRAGMAVPADLYLEGSDQHRGWFHTSLLASVGVSGEAPFKKVLTHGFVMFAKGQKMSKSLGNVIDPRDIISKDGADILRLWAAHEDYAQDLTCNPEMFQRLTETYRRIRNTLRYMLGNLSDFQPSHDQVPFEQMSEIDRWALAELARLIENVKQSYEEYSFYKIYHHINNFATVELSAIYLDVLKDRLYTAKKNGRLRRSSQTALYQICQTLIQLLAPVLTFLSEEAYSHLPGEKLESVLLTDFPQASKGWQNQPLLQSYAKLLEVRSEVAKKLEELRQAKVIGSSLDAEIEIQELDETYRLLKEREADLSAFFIVSKVHLKEGSRQVIAKAASGEKCVRCWHWSTKIGSNPEFPGVCPKCVEALS